MSACWPESWSGQTHLECGEHGQILTSVSTPSTPTGAHQKTFHLIADRWSAIWPQFKSAIDALMEKYRHDQILPDWSNIRLLYLELPDEPIAEEAERSIGVVFSGADTIWTLPFTGLIAAPERAQAIW